MIPSSARVLVAPLLRRRGARVAFIEALPQPPAPVRRPANVARILALAHHIQRAIDSGTFDDQASVAQSLGFTRARITQLLDLLLLAPAIQETVLHLEAIDGVEPLSERTLREIVKHTLWADQRGCWADLCPPTAG